MKSRTRRNNNGGGMGYQPQFPPPVGAVQPESPPEQKLKHYKNFSIFPAPGVDQPPTTRGEPSKKIPRNPPGLGAVRPSIGNSDGANSAKVPPSNVPFRNYWGLSNPAPSRREYNFGFEDHTPITFRRNINASGLQDVQLRNPVASTSRKRIVLYTAAGYLWAVAPRIPGQSRDNFGGFHQRGVDPQSYAAMWNAGPGSQPVNPGGPGKIAGRQFVTGGASS
jgi:hypothetical protein